MSRYCKDHVEIYKEKATVDVCGLTIKVHVGNVSKVFDIPDYRSPKELEGHIDKVLKDNNYI